MNASIRAMSAEAHEIIIHIRDCQELTFQQRDELMKLVGEDVEMKRALAKEMFYFWTGVNLQTETRGE